MTRSLADRTETQRPRGNGSVAASADYGVPRPAQCVDGIGAPAAAHSDVITGFTRQLNQLTEELSESRLRADQLKAALEKHTRRVQQLIGERDQLTSLLARRDAELQRLNRELGALSTREGAGQVRSPTMLATARNLLDRFQRARRVPREAKPARLGPPRADIRIDKTRLVPWIKDRPPKDVLAVVLFGLSEAEIERVLQVVERYCTERDFAPLLLTDNDAFQVFRGRRVLFEYLPARSDQERLAPELDWRLYTLRRLALIRRKWQPIRVVAFGHRAAAVVKLWRDSPFEGTSIPAALNGSSASAEFPRCPAQLGAW